MKEQPMMSAWTYTIPKEGGESPNVAKFQSRWERVLTREEEDAAVAAAEKKLQRYTDRKIMLILHEFGWPGTNAWTEWLREQLSAGAQAESTLANERARHRGVAAALESDIKELTEEVARLKSAKKRAPRRKPTP